MHPWVQSVHTAFSGADNPKIAAPMSAYMKNHFPFHGITSQHRTELLKDLLNKENLPEYRDLSLVCHQLWELPQREYVYAALSLLAKFNKRLNPSDIPWIIALITKKRLVGLRRHPGRKCLEFLGKSVARYLVAPF